MTKTNEC